MHEEGGWITVGGKMEGESGRQKEREGEGEDRRRETERERRRREEEREKLANISFLPLYLFFPFCIS